MSVKSPLTPSRLPVLRTCSSCFRVFLGRRGHECRRCKRFRQSFR